jgi:predicted enzyme related to lactoylglutathione lyase
MTAPQLDIGIVTREHEAMLGFYRDGLQLEPTEPMVFPGMSIQPFRFGASLVKLVTLDPVPDATNPPDGLRAATGIRYLTLQVDRLDDTVASSVAHGGTLLREGAMGDLRLAHIVDPDGNAIELIGP